MLTLSDADFKRLYTYIQKNYGIDLSKKKQLIVGRLSNELSAKGYTDFKPFVDQILSGSDPASTTSMLNKLTTNYTYFMREENHFKYMMSTVLPQLTKKHASDKSIAIWSAGCSSGQEPYTICMHLMEYFGSQFPSWDTRILATDISPQILQSAMNPTYTEADLEQLPPKWKEKYFVSKGPGTYTVAPKVRNNVIFQTFNLMDPIRFRRQFDLIFCRNVMIYFDQPTKDALINRFYGATLPGGYLFIGHSENLNKETNPYRYIMPAIFQKVPSSMTDTTKRRFP